jgi:cyclopropane-fatty-acyl-phospholipid synthase
MNSPSAAQHDRKPALSGSLTSETVVDCYEFFDHVFPECGLRDLTEGMYHGDPAVSYEQAQRNQVEWLLDEIRCTRGSRILDIGCGYGTLLEAARERGAKAVGITVSSAQAARCLANGLDVRLFDYRNLPEDWAGTFDGIVANGSAEHFVQPEDVRAGQADQVYHTLFAICQRLLDPRSSSRRFATTIIHQCEYSPQLDADELLKHPWSFPWGSLKFHYAMLQRTFGGFYPEPEQLERCAVPFFRKAGEVDGTEDYHLTSEEWVSRVNKALRSWRVGPKVWRRLAAYLLRRPGHCFYMSCCLFVTESWQRQFRGEHPPTRLLRQTWECVQP